MDEKQPFLRSKITLNQLALLLQATLGIKKSLELSQQSKNIMANATTKPATARTTKKK